MKDLGVLSSDPGRFSNLGRLVLFRTLEGALWRTDGTAAGTMRVSETGPGVPSAGATRFFEGSDAEHGYELWKTDATAAGTVFVKDINPGPRRTGGGSSYPREFTEAAGVVFFIACDGTHGWELWRTDGTEAGTVMVKDIDTRTAPGPPGSDGCLSGGWRHRDLREMNGRLYFLADDGGDGVGLWHSDGTEEGTFLVRGVVRERPLGPRDTRGPVEHLTRAAGLLFFTTRTTLWTSDGTTAGSTALPWVPNDFVAGTPSLFFYVWGAGVGRSDGTVAGTYTLRNMDIPTDIRFASRTTQLATVGERLFFLAGHETSLWISDGTPEGTMAVRVEDAAAPPALPFSLTPHEGSLYFIASDAVQGRQLWRAGSDGRGQRLTAIEGQVAPEPGYGDRDEDTVGTVGPMVLFPANGAGRGTELWGIRTR